MRTGNSVWTGSSNMAPGQRICPGDAGGADTVAHRRREAEELDGEEPPHEPEQVVGCKGLREQVPAREDEPSAGQVLGGVARHQDDRYSRRSCGNPRGQLRAGQVRHHHIGEHEVAGAYAPLEHAPRLLPVGGDDRVVPGLSQDPGHQREHQWVVFSDQDGGQLEPYLEGWFNL